MDTTEKPRYTDAHVGDVNATRFAPATYATRGGSSAPSGKHCTYCGSITPEDAIAMLRTPGTDFSGSDWKYGWPHKFYIGNVKFYSLHMIDASPETIAAWNTYAEPLLGVGFSMEQGTLHYRARTRGYQTAGQVPPA